MSPEEGGFRIARPQKPASRTPKQNSLIRAAQAALSQQHPSVKAEPITSTANYTTADQHAHLVPTPVSFAQPPRQPSPEALPETIPIAITKKPARGARGTKRKATAAGGSNAEADSAGPSEVEATAPPPVRKARSRKKEPQAQQQLPPDFPKDLIELEQTFQSLNTVYSFCSVQRQMICTLDNVRTSIQDLTGRPFTLADLGKMRVIAPDMMTLFWVDRADLEEASIRELRDINPAAGSPQYVLVIDFRDARPVRMNPAKKKAVDRSGRPVINRHISLAEETAPSQHTGSIPTMIERRNTRFREQLLAFYTREIDNGTDPVTSISELAIDAVPTSPGIDTTPGPYGKSTTPPAIDRPHSMLEMLQDLEKEEFYKDQIKNVKTVPGREATFADLNSPLSDALAKSLKESLNVSRLYAHQAEAINYVEAGHDVIVATSTSSGKSLIYQLPLLRELERNPEARAIYIFPTKALAQDQKRALQTVLASTPHLSWVEVDTYDGDTPLKGDSRTAIRDNARVIFTNPDMLHVSVLPRHKYWREFLERVRFVIVDELHYYTNTFGSHCAMIMRRLRRLCHHYSNDRVRFISCSATVANPDDHMKSFFNLTDVRVVREDGSPCGMKHYVMWNPPYRDERHPAQGRTSFLEESVRVLCWLMMKGVRVICFAKVRRMCELVLRETQNTLREVAPVLEGRVMGYRAGYTPEDRRKIEGRLFKGDLLCVIATNALELGVDIGSLDAVVHLSFPFNLASFRQQAGRAGRRERDSVSILVADGDNALDQFYMKEPENLFNTEVELSGVELENELVLEAHLQCAAAEVPVRVEEDVAWFGERVGSLCQKGLLWDEGLKLYFPHRKYEGQPSRHIQIRSIDEETYRVIDVTTNKDIEDIEASRVPFTLYEGSVFIHQGRSYMVNEVNAERMYAKVRPSNVDYVTANRDFTNVDPTRTVETLVFGRGEGGRGVRGRVCYGEVRVTTVVFGYFKIDPKSKRILDAVAGLENPPVVKVRFGFWIDVPQTTVSELKRLNHNVEFSIHAASHALLSLLPTCVVMPTTGMTDIRTECKHPSATRARPARIIVYDGAGRGGLTFKAFRHCEELLARAKAVVEGCECEEGCPACIHRTSCKEANAALDKKGCVVVLKGILGDGGGDALGGGVVVEEEKVKEVDQLV
ncbi:hypothetical protein HDV00_000160 [Rhizophlyctis rosea]|nr:hypothetical protein HDV00_000160 [Rhizophlyctis rosea]